MSYLPQFPALHSGSRAASMRACGMVILSLLLAACSSTPTQPTWLQNAAADYPENRYLSASGQADEQNTADARALANLARIFEVAINDTSMDFSAATIENNTTSNTLEASRSVTTQAQQVLQGAKIVEHWEAEDGSNFSLAVLEKAPAARRLREAVQQADLQTNQLLDYARDRAPNPVAALSALEQARQVQQQRENANRTLAVVNNFGISGEHSQAQIEAMIRRSLATLQFGAQAAQPEVMGAVQSAISTLGITYRPDADYQVWGAMDSTPIQKQQGWYWLRGSMQLSLRKDGDAIATQRWPIKVSATDENMVMQRARDQLNNDLSGQLYQLLVSAGAELRQPQ